MMRIALTVALITTLAGCGATRERTTVQRVSVPVTVPCALQRPAKPASLKAQTPGWDTMDVAQKTAAASAWALDLLIWGEQTDAATAGCE